jgi:hypothetical protein
MPDALCLTDDAWNYRGAGTATLFAGTICA